MFSPIIILRSASLSEGQGQIVPTGITVFSKVFRSQLACIDPLVV